MKKNFVKIVLLALPVVLIVSSSILAKPVAANISALSQIHQGSDLESRLQAVEKRIAALKQSVTTKPQFKQHRGTLSTLENKKNTLKAQLKTPPKDNASRPQLEKELKSLEDKVSELEGQIK